MSFSAIPTEDLEAWCGLDLAIKDAGLSSNEITAQTHANLAKIRKIAHVRSRSRMYSSQAMVLQEFEKQVQAEEMKKDGNCN